MPKRPKNPLPEYPIVCTNGKLWICTKTGEVSFEERETGRDGPLTYEPDAECPEWDNIVKQIFSLNAETDRVIRYLYEIVGWLIWKTTVADLKFVFTGHLRSGKHELVKVIRPLLQRDKASAVKYFGEFPDPPNQKMDGHRTFILPFHKVFTRDEEEALIFRWEYIATHELPGILNKAIKGASDCIKRGGFCHPPECIEMKKEWLARKSQVQRFIDECCYSDKTMIHGEAAKDVYLAYQYWRSFGEEHHGRNTFYDKLRDLGYDVYKGWGNKKKVKGLLLREDAKPSYDF